ncbi:MAG TPA: dihydroorotate dehydrogenase electron transfer subunit [Clostridia bacterium]|jgi:dihydroorotate dehydrogenase electron transfer subunit|nr:dihydroorotate dehydrogenase electron transfer subunit [Clostridia bacterium]
MIKQNCRVTENTEIAPKFFRMVLECEKVSIKAGQFINITVDGFYLRRPISICDFDDRTITIIYKIMGEGTAMLAKTPSGAYLDCLIGLGNGFDTSVKCETPLIIGGGVGAPPLFALAKKLAADGKKPKVLLGFNTSQEAILVKEFESRNIPVVLATLDGTAGHKGFVTELIESGYDYFYACGPLPMLKAVYNNTETDGQLSLEERMGCGFGACMGCSIMTKGGAKRVCKEGPVFYKEELLWQTQE